MRARTWTALPVAVLAVVASSAACGDDGGGEAASTTTAVTAAPAGSTTTAAPTTPSVTDVFPTVSLPCQPLPTPATPLTSPATAGSVLLADVQRRGDRCVDHVVFSFTTKTADPPGYRVEYGTPPFAADGSGDVVPVRGEGFVVVRLEPAYGYDFENGRPTYTGPRRIAAEGANHVTEIVQTGDFEGVVTWVIGLDEKRPFAVQATGTPRPQLVVTVG
jgi:hypothetical protein